MEGSGKVHIGKNYEERLNHLIGVIPEVTSDNELVRLLIDRAYDDVRSNSLTEVPRYALGVKIDALKGVRG